VAIALGTIFAAPAGLNPLNETVSPSFMYDAASSGVKMGYDVILIEGNLALLFKSYSIFSDFSDSGFLNAWNINADEILPFLRTSLMACLRLFIERWLSRI
jgi:hypothetical protein